MTTAPFAWPALELGQRSPPTRLVYGRAVWGKAHAARTDFRWLARSAGFDDRRQGRPLEAELNLGTEDLAARRAEQWRNLGEPCFAVSCYRSQAVDAAGRKDFLEKQVLEWSRPDGLPAALGALLLLPTVAALGDETWWERRMELMDPEAVLPIAPAECEPVPCNERALEAAIEHGRAALRQAVGEQALERLYLDLLAGRRPAALAGVGEPLPPAALGALLLPLPRRLADKISLAGWIPSSRATLESLGERWEVVVLPTQAAVTAGGPVEEGLRPEASRMALAVLRDGGAGLPPAAVAAGPAAAPPAVAPPPPKPAPSPPPPAIAPGGARDLPRPGLAAGLPEPPPGSPEILRELYDFARRADRRWLDPDELSRRRGGDLRPLAGAAARELLIGWALAVERLKPAYAHAEQWQAKADLLRSAALVLAPAARTYREVGLPAGRRVPSLVFGHALHRSRWDELWQLEEGPLRAMIDQSLQCLPSRWTAKVRAWLNAWVSATRQRQIKALIGASLSDHPS